MRVSAGAAGWERESGFSFERERGRMGKTGPSMGESSSNVKKFSWGVFPPRGRPRNNGWQVTVISAEIGTCPRITPTGKMFKCQN